MPRRYSDYRDVFYGWNRIRRFGRFLSAFGTMIFFYIVTISLVEARPVLFHTYKVTSLDLAPRTLPLRRHTFTEAPFVVRVITK